MQNQLNELKRKMLEFFQQKQKNKKIKNQLDLARKVQVPKNLKP
ncbi:TPA: NAD(FAD)-dependent dehydrogenase [Streptococcus pneumoniae]|nr:NAD(FAD)-dependent dehydrogenase [Streptococcus pneumoniae]